MKSHLSLVLFLSVCISYAQTFKKATIQLNSANPIQGKAYIDNNAKTVIVKSNGTNKSYAFEKIASINIKGKTYTKQEIKGETYLASVLASGKANLFALDHKSYAIDIVDRSGHRFNIMEDQQRIGGILSVLFADCNSLRDKLNKESHYTESKLLTYVSDYNNCNYGSYTPTTTEINRAALFNTDVAHFYVGLNTNFNAVSFFENSATESTTAIGLIAGVAASPSFTANFQGNLYFYLEGAALFSGDRNFSNNIEDVNFNRNSLSFLLGTQYVFNKDGLIQPFLGIGIGFVSDSYEGSVDGNSFDVSGGNPIYAPRAGFFMKVKDKKRIGITASYIPEYENDLSFPLEETIVPLIVNTSSITVGVYYIF